MANLETIVKKIHVGTILGGLVALGAASGVDKEPEWYMGALKSAAEVPYNVFGSTGLYILEKLGDAVDNLREYPVQTLASAGVAYALMRLGSHFLYHRRRPHPVHYTPPVPPPAPGAPAPR